MRFLKLTTSKRGRRIGHLEGYIYNFSCDLPDSKLRWRCNQSGFQCRLVLSKNYDVLLEIEHNHDSVSQKSKVMISIEKMNEASIDKNLNITTAFTAETSKMKDEELILLPKFQSLRDRITRKRNVLNLQSGSTYDELPDFLRNTLDGKEFLKIDSGVNDESRVLIFYSDFSFDCLKKSDFV
jgi:hypothetical protein